MASNQAIKRVKYALRFIPDSLYIKLYYRLKMKERCNLDNPVTYSEKLQWLKLHDRQPEYVRMVDKFTAKGIAAKVIGFEHIVPTLGVWNEFDEIDFADLPESFVLKATHDSEGVVIARDKAVLDKADAKKRIEKAMRYNFYYIGREWPYKGVNPCIIAEELLVNTGFGDDMPDYKFFCFDGEPRFLYVATGRQAHATRFDFFDMNYSRLDITQAYPNSDCPPPKPRFFDDMVEAARRLSQGYPHVRIDFYETDDNWYFGEYTFYSLSGFAPFYPSKWDKTFGEWLELPQGEGGGLG